MTDIDPAIHDHTVDQNLTRLRRDSSAYLTAAELEGLHDMLRLHRNKIEVIALRIKHYHDQFPSDPVEAVVAESFIDLAESVSATMLDIRDVFATLAQTAKVAAQCTYKAADEAEVTTAIGRAMKMERNARHGGDEDRREGSP